MTPPPGSWPPDEQQTERVRRQRALAERLAAQQQLDNARMASAPTKSRLRRRRRRPGNNRFVAILAVIALIATVLTAERWAGSGEGGLEWAGGTGNFGEQSTQVDRPTPQDDPSPTPLGTPPPLPTADGNFAFIAMRPDAPERPVTYDPCRTIRYVVNNAEAPPGVDLMVQEALVAASDATGLVFEAVGPTDEAPSAARKAYQPDRYGDVWAPVLIGWTSPENESTLAGAVAGLGGSSWLEVDDVEVDGKRVDRTSVFVSGHIALDGPQIAELLAQGPEGRRAALAVVTHEVGHLLGLDHVPDPTQLMNPEGSLGINEFQAGDRRGLNQLGQGPCIPEL